GDPIRLPNRADERRRRFRVQQERRLEALPLQNHRPHARHDRDQGSRQKRRRGSDEPRPRDCGEARGRILRRSDRFGGRDRRSPAIAYAGRKLIWDSRSDQSEEKLSTMGWFTGCSTERLPGRVARIVFIPASLAASNSAIASEIKTISAG